MAIQGNGKTQIYVVNVGQADTAVIVSPKGNLTLIDMVNSEKVKRLLRDLGLPAQGEIEELVITHPHTDHYRGANALMKDFRVESATLAPFWNQYGMGPPTYREMLNTMEVNQTNIDFVSGYSRMYPDGATTHDGEHFAHEESAFYIELLGPSNSLLSQLERDKKLDTNHLSIISRVHWQRFSMILAGDAQMENWSYFDQEGMLGEGCDVLKSAHHGSCNGTQWERLMRLDPRCVIISSDPDKGHHLPDLVGASIFSKYDADEEEKIVALTCDSGTIRITVTKIGSYDLEKCSEAVDDPVDLATFTPLTKDDHPTNWSALLSKRKEELYRES